MLRRSASKAAPIWPHSALRASSRLFRSHDEIVDVVQIFTVRADCHGAERNPQLADHRSTVTGAYGASKRMSRLTLTLKRYPTGILMVG